MELNSSSPSSSHQPPPPPSIARLWKPAAQRNLRNKWSTLSTLRQQWASFSSAARSHATALVNAHLSQRYMKGMELGALSDMPNLRKKACSKLLRQQELHHRNLLSSYKEMVSVVTNMVSTSASMRCFLKGTNTSSLSQFSSSSEDNNDIGDCGGIAVFMFWSISSFERLAWELVQMFSLELTLKRLLIVEFLSVSCEVSPKNEMGWSNELYPGEFHDLSRCSREACDPGPPVLPGLEPDTMPQPNQQPDPNVVQVYLTTWLAEVNVDKQRVEEIFTQVGEEMQVTFTLSHSSLN